MHINCTSINYVKHHIINYRVDREFFNFQKFILTSQSRIVQFLIFVSGLWLNIVLSFKNDGLHEKKALINKIKHLFIFIVMMQFSFLCRLIHIIKWRCTNAIINLFTVTRLTEIESVRPENQNKLKL